MQRRGFFGGLLGLFAAGSVPVAAAVEPMQFDDDWSEYESALYRMSRKMNIGHDDAVELVNLDRARMKAVANATLKAFWNTEVTSSSISGTVYNLSDECLTAAEIKPYYSVHPAAVR